MAQSDDKTILAVKQQFSIVGNSSALNSAIERALKVAPFDLSVLIIGESGSGKEFFPQIIHRYSKRRNNRYTVVNCGAIPEGTIESELFGHVKGAFTGADKDRKGYFEETNGGTIFLDEVAEMPLATQARLLRVLQNGEYIKVGSDVVQKTNVRVVAATNKDLMKAVKEGRFREDLYYRLSTIQIDIPALRERSDDISMIVRVFAHDFADKYNTPPVKFSESALNALTMYSWPGNVRELKNVTERISVIEEKRDITADILRLYLPNVLVEKLPVLVKSEQEQKQFNSEREILYQVLFDMRKDVNELKKLVHEIMNGQVPMAQDVQDLSASVGNLSHLTTTPTFSQPIQAPIHTIHSTIQDAEDVEEETLSLEEVEKDMIRKALERHNGRRKNAAADLKISERTLYRKIKEYNLE